MVALIHTAPASRVVRRVAYAARVAQAASGYTAAERTAIEAAFELARKRYGDAPTAEGERLARPRDRHRDDRRRAQARCRIGARRAADRRPGHRAASTSEKFAAEAGDEVAKLVTGVARMGAIRTVSLAKAARTRKRATRRPRTCARCCWRWSRTSASCWSSSPSARRRCAIWSQPRCADARGTPRRATQRCAARETQDLFAPLANRLGVWQFKWELEDLAFARSSPSLQAGSPPLLDERRIDRQRYIDQAVADAPARARRRRRQGRGHRPAEAHLQHLEQDAPQAASASTRSTTSARCASWSTTSRTATPRSASCTTCGRRCRRSSTTTSPSRRPTTTARCTPR